MSGYFIQATRVLLTTQLLDNHMKSYLAIAVSTLSLVGCASITGDTVQSVRVETYTASGEEIKGATCKLENEYGTFNVTTPGQAMVRRSGQDMNVLCEKSGHPDAKASMTSRANGGMWGNILFGGGVGAVIDHNKGTAYTYPQWLKMTFGKVMAFDRSSDKDGQPSLARDTAIPAPAPQANAGTDLPKN